MPPKSRRNSLQQAASAVFAVTTVVPLLIFVWTLHRVGALGHVQSQVGLGLALALALFGFYIFRRLMGQMSALIEGLGRAVDRGSRPQIQASAAVRAPGLITEYRPPLPATHTAPMPAVPAPPAAGRAVPVTAAVAAPAPPRPKVAAPIEEDDEPDASARSVPGLGTIREVDDLSRAMAKLWMSEASAYKGRRVALSVMNSRVPVTGTLVDLTLDGLLVEQDGGREVAVSYSRLSGIDAA
jgi:hypothetical protein